MSSAYRVRFWAIVTIAVMLVSSGCRSDNDENADDYDATTSRSNGSASDSATDGADPDTDADSATDGADPDTDPDTDADTNVDPDTDTDTNVDPGTDPDTDPDTDTDMGIANELIWDTVSNLGGSLTDVVTTPTLLVTLGQYGKIYTSPHSFPPEWTERSSGVTTWLNGICWSGTQFVAVGRSGVVLTSPDGDVWTQGISDTEFFLNDVAWNGEKFMAVGQSGVVLSSSNGIDWATSQIEHHVNSELAGVFWIDDRWFVIGSNTIVTSADGSAWTDHSDAFEDGGVHNPNGNLNYHFEGIVHSGERYMLWYASTYARSETFSSTGLDHWEVVSPDGLGASGVSNMVWTGTHFVSVNWSTGALSADGFSWEVLSLPSNGTSSYDALVFSGTHLLAVGSGKIAFAHWPN